MTPQHFTRSGSAPVKLSFVRYGDLTCATPFLQMIDAPYGLRSQITATKDTSVETLMKLILENKVRVLCFGCRTVRYRIGRLRWATFEEVNVEFQV